MPITTRSARIPKRRQVAALQEASRYARIAFAMFNPQPLNHRPVESRANLFGD